MQGVVYYHNEFSNEVEAEPPAEWAAEAVDQQPASAAIRVTVKPHSVMGEMEVCKPLSDVSLLCGGQELAKGALFLPNSPIAFVAYAPEFNDDPATRPLTDTAICSVDRHELK